MKSYTIIQTLFLITVLFSYATAFGQLSGWDQDPYTGTMPAVLNTGSLPQTKSGGSAIIGIRLLENGIESDTAWLSSALKSGQLAPALFSDSSIAVYRHSVLGINPSWSNDSSVFSFDTNVPIATNGVMSQNTIMATVGVETALLGYSNFANPLGGQVLMCSHDENGSLYECESQEKPVITMSVSPDSVSANSSERVTISWEAQNADECHAINGPGFFADKQLQGEDMSNGIDQASGSVVEFTLGCTNQLGTVIFKSAQVSVQ